MKRLNCVLPILVAITAMLIFYANAAEELYSDKFDHIDPDEILNNDSLREQYYKCFMDTGPCVTEDAAYIKANIAEAVVTKCRRCTEKQKENFEKLIVWYNENRPDEINAFIQKMLEDAKKLKLSKR